MRRAGPRSSAMSSSRRGSSTSRCNGIGPVDFWRADPEQWRAAGRRLLAGGATSYLPTLVSAPRDGYRDALARVAAAQADAETAGLPRIEGVHLEGPFLGDAPGAHPPELLGPVDLEWLLDLARLRSRAWCGW